MKPRVDKARVPDGTPVGKHWHVNRAGLVSTVCGALQRGSDPRVVGLVGPSGAGKTTAAAQVVKNIEALKFFSDGMVWLSVNSCAVESGTRVSSLMLELAKAVHEDVMGRICRAPTAEEDLAGYVKGRMDALHGGRGLRCLVVVDNVSDREVVAELRKTGMWVLMTTRSIDLVVDAEGEPVEVDRLSQGQAEALLRDASRLELGERLPDSAGEIIKLCNRFVLDVEFIGRWGPLRRRRHRRNFGDDDDPWWDAASKIREQLAVVKGEGEEDRLSDVEERRAAVLRAGLTYLEQAGRLNRDLYLALAVLPDGYAFSVKEAARLLYDEGRTTENKQAVRDAVDTLEGWAVLSAAGGRRRRYRMQDAHASFARQTFMASVDGEDNGALHRRVVRRWSDYISSLATVRKIGDSCVLAGLWRALVRVGGDCWRSSRPYEEALAEMDVSDVFYFPSLEAVASLYSLSDDRDGASAVMRRILDLYDLNPELDPRIVASTLWFCTVGVATNEDEDAEEHIVRLQLGAALCDPELERCRRSLIDTDTTAAVGVQHAATPEEKVFSLYVLGVCLSIVGRSKDAEELFRRALATQEAMDIPADHPLVVYTTHMLGHSLRQAGRPSEAIDCLRGVVKAVVEKLGPNHVSVGYLLHELGASMREAGFSQQAETLVWRALDIKEASLGSENLQVAFTLHELGVCVRDSGKTVEAQQLFVQVCTN